MSTMDVLASEIPAHATENLAVRMTPPAATPRLFAPAAAASSVLASSVLAAGPAGAPAGALGTIDTLLRDRAATLARIERGESLADLVRTMLVTIAVSCAIFGAAVGMYRGGVQILYAAIKFPLVMLLTAAITAPCLTAFNAALDRPHALRRDVALVMLALGFGSLLLVAQAPILLLAALLDCEYHKFILMTSGCAALAGLGSLVVLGRGVRGQSGRHAQITAMALVGVLAVVGAQMAWTMRPYVVRPRTTEIPFVRQIEGSLIEAVMGSSRSARGIYADDWADDREQDWEDQRRNEWQDEAPSAVPSDVQNAEPAAAPGDVQNAEPAAVPGDVQNAEPGAVPGDVQNAEPGAVPGDVQNAVPGEMPAASGDVRQIPDEPSDAVQTHSTEDLQ